MGGEKHAAVLKGSKETGRLEEEEMSSEGPRAGARFIWRTLVGSWPFVCLRWVLSRGVTQPGLTSKATPGCTENRQ